MKSQIKRTIAILLLVCFLVSLTAASVSAGPTPFPSGDQTSRWAAMGEMPPTAFVGGPHGPASHALATANANAGLSGWYLS